MTKRSGVEDPRSVARESALTLLYEAESKGVTPRDVVDAQVIPVDQVVRLLVLGVMEHQSEIDASITAHSTGWTIERMPALDRNILRVATFELMQRADVPTAVILDEAVELAKRFSTDDSGRFVNGVLSAIAAEVR
ncbi:MAG: transcription antitermination factor NusB [Ilumatobacteraceae bacterium]|nr:transcription antitermination factor NusB [Ilumatobacteraceae bacterium]